MRRVIRPQSRHHLWLYDEDWEFVVAHVVPRTRLPPGSWIREMLHRLVLQIREERYLTQEAGERLLDSIEKEDTMSKQSIAYPPEER
jgi:hypothetical protein